MSQRPDAGKCTSRGESEKLLPAACRRAWNRGSIFGIEAREASEPVVSTDWKRPWLTWNSVSPTDLDVVESVLGPRTAQFGELSARTGFVDI